MNYFKRIKSYLRIPSLSILSESPQVIAAGKRLVQFFYLIVPYLAYLFLQTWPTPLTRPNFDPVWPLLWSHIFSLTDDWTVNIVRFGFLGASLAGVLFYKKWAGRVVVFIGIWQAHALESSFGEPNHQWYLLLYTAFIFIFLPDAVWKKNNDVSEARRSFLLVIWWAQAIVMLTYTMAGFWKIVMGFEQFWLGQINSFSHYAFSYQVANWLPKLQNEAPLGAFIINHPDIAWPLYLITLYMQFFALWTMVRPSLQRLWAFDLLLFHIGTYLVMGISFDQSVIAVLILFFASPFTPQYVSWKAIVYDLPIIGQLLEPLQRRSEFLHRRGFTKAEVHGIVATFQQQIKRRFK